MDKFTTSSPWQYLADEQKSYKGYTITQYLNEKCQGFIDQGLGQFNWIVDTITGESFNYEDFNKYTRNIASALYKKGMRKGDTLIYINTSIVRQSILHAGVWRCNGVIRASYPEDTTDTLLDRIIESKVRWVVCEVDTVDYVYTALRNSRLKWPVEILVYGQAEGCTSIDELFHDDGLACPKPEVTENDPCTILCTSGTTGKSKGAVYRHKVLVSILVQMELAPLETNSLLCLKSTHASGLVFPMIFLIRAKKILVMNKISLDNILYSIDKFKPKVMFSFPAFFLGIVGNPENFVKYDLTSLEVCMSGGVAISPALETSMRKLPNFKHFVIFYGLTEALPVALSSDGSNIHKCARLDGLPLGSVGKVFPNVWIRIRDLSSGKYLERGERGEIVLKSPTVFSYYLNQPEETRETFVDGDSGEWLKTGDMGYIDRDGSLFVLDRIKEVFKCGGNHVSPAEIDSVIMGHPAISDACTIGVKDTEGDDLMPRAFVTLKKGHFASPNDIKEFVNAKLAKYKHIRGGLYIVNELPKGKTGKVTRNEVAKLKISQDQ